ncbi:dirigent protein 21-like [Salvia hispanica]|uniref:dirigent protein 21-like n=1 Tax=Salvia hispanica TaxID=49212 RepID=UPI0020093D3E|nr:dirigent protein 21-like [Salvia hispanica]
MAKVPTFSLIIIIILLSLLAISLPTSSQGFSTKLSKREMRRPEQLTHLHFYLHNLLRGEATNVVVAQAATTNTYKYRLDEVAVFDDWLTERPNLGELSVGNSCIHLMSAAEIAYKNTDLDS